MTNFNKITEIRLVNDEYRSLKKEIKKRRLKLKTIYSKFSFIAEIVNPEVPDLQLELSVKNLFVDLGYNAKKPYTEQDLDVIARLGKDMIGIEVKNDKHVRENELFQAIKYTKRYKKKWSNNASSDYLE